MMWICAITFCFVLISHRNTNDKWLVNRIFKILPEIHTPKNINTNNCIKMKNGSGNYLCILQISRVKHDVKSCNTITFEEFKNFYHVLFGGSDLERAMFFLDTEKAGVNK